jgi:hypothetical protein
MQKLRYWMRLARFGKSVPGRSDRQILWSADGFRQQEDTNVPEQRWRRCHYPPGFGNLRRDTEAEVFADGAKRNEKLGPNTAEEARLQERRGK